MKKIKLVLVDDHKIFLDGLVSVLSSEPHFEILFCENRAVEALKKLKNNEPDLIITDISMPEMNGLEFIHALKTDFPNVKILVLSMFKNLNSFKDIHGFLLKETDSKTLIKVINEIVIHNQKHFLNTQNNTDALQFKKSMLSSREKEIIQLIAQELTTEEIAKKLIISKHTIEAHRKNIFFKLQVNNIAGLVNMAVRLGVIEL
jgi:DNA-binding NarL/FixJ family response regulator